MDAPYESHVGVRQHSVGLPDAMDDMSSHAWPVTATGHVEACPLPSRCQKFDPKLVLSHL
jgi:hypothetical protein